MNQNNISLFLFFLFFSLSVNAQINLGRWFEKDGLERKDISRLSEASRGTISNLNSVWDTYRAQVLLKNQGLSIDIQRTNEKYRAFEQILNYFDRQTEGDRALGLASLVSTQNEILPPSRAVFSLFFEIYNRLINKIESGSFPNVPREKIYDAPIKGFVGWILGPKDHARQVQALLVGKDPLDYKEDMSPVKLAIFRQLNFLKKEERYGFLSGLKLLEQRRVLQIELLRFERSLVGGKKPLCKPLVEILGSEIPSTPSEPKISDLMSWTKSFDLQLVSDLKYFSIPDGNLILDGLANAAAAEHPEVGPVVVNLKRLLGSYMTLYRVEVRAAQQGFSLGLDPIRFRLDPRILASPCEEKQK